MIGHLSEHIWLAFNVFLTYMVLDYFWMDKVYLKLLSF
jgi:hypothetical protein